MSSSHSWFVQTGFGAVLGPMPDDALSEMVRTGALLHNDLVRHGPSDDWQPASAVPGLFAESASLMTEDAPSIEDAPAVEDVASRISVDGTFTLRLPESPSREKRMSPERRTAFAKSKVPSPKPIPKDHPPVDRTARDRSLPMKPVSPAMPIVAADAEPNSPQFTAEDDLIANWKAQRRQTQEQLALTPLSEEVEHASDDSVLESIPDLFSDAPAPEVVDQSSEAVRMMLRPSLLSLIKPRLPTPETFAQKCQRWKRSLPIWPIAAVLVVVLLAAWWSWPRPQRGINHRFLNIWTELQSRRTDFKDKAGFEQFVAGAQSEVNELVPWLEKHASAKDREKQLLLYIGRDCLRPMLKKPREAGSAQEKKLEMLFEALQDLYDPLRPIKLSPASVGDNNTQSPIADLEKAASGGVLDPSALRRQPSVKAAKPPTK